MSPILRLAGRDFSATLRAGLSGVRVLIAVLALGVAALAAGGGAVESVRGGLADRGRSLLGGDAEASRLYRPFSAAERARMLAFGRVSETATLRAMARTSAGDRVRMVELKAVDGAYPLVGRLDTDPPLPPAAVFARRDGVPGAALDPVLLDRLGVAPGETIRIGNGLFAIRATIVSEPDRISQPFVLGPRVLIAAADLPATGLLLPGSLVTHAARILLDRTVAGGGVPPAVSAALSGPGVRWRGVADAAPGTQRFLDSIGRFLSMAALSTLLVGGLGVAAAASAIVESRKPQVAILKSVGATTPEIVSILGLSLGGFAGIGIVLGLLAGALVPFALSPFAAGLGFAPRAGLFVRPFVSAGGFGILVAFAFILWPLLRVRDVAPAVLFRDAAEHAPSPPSLRARAALAAAVLCIAGLAFALFDRAVFALAFVAGAAGLLLAFRGAVPPLRRLAGFLAARVPAGLPRLSLAGLARPGGPLAPVLVSLGLGAAAMAALIQVQGAISREVGTARAADHPTHYYTDIQPDQREAFAATARRFEGVTMLDAAPMIRGRIVALDGRPLDREAVAPDARWAVDRDVGLTVAADPPRGSRIVAGRWWGRDPGPPRVSVAADVARGLGLSPGGTVTLNVLGREMTATVASLREVRWTTLAMNFVFVFSPGFLDGAPATWIATLDVPPKVEAAFAADLAVRLPNVIGIPVADVLARVQAIADAGAAAVAGVAALCIAAGLLVMAGAVAATLPSRTAEAVILKVLGARGSDLIRAAVLEYAVLGILVGLASTLAGAGISWAFVRFVLRLEWVFLPGRAALLVLALALAAALAAALLLGRSLAARPGPALRHL